MLEYLRNASEKPVAKFFIAVLAFSFVGWGVAEWIFGGGVGDNTMVRVGNTEISANQFSLEKSRELAKLSKEQQREIYTDAAAGNAFAQKVMTKLATQQMAENRADDLGFVVSDKRIAQEIREFPEFQVNGEFSTLAFDTVLNNSGYSEADFAEVLRGNVLRSMVLGAVSIEVPVPQFAVQAMYNARYGSREIEYATVDYSDFAAEKPTDKQLSEFYAKNPKIIPEQRSVSYVFIPAEMAQPDKYEVGYAAAVKVEDDIIAGESMKDAAEKHSAKYVNLGTFARDKRPVDSVLTDKIVAKLFDMDEGLESEMIETKDGFLFLRVDKVLPAHTAEFDSVKNSLVADWQKDQKKKQAYVRANEILVKLNKEKVFDGAKKATVSRASGAPLDVLVAAFRNDIETNAIVSGSDAFYVLRVKSAKMPTVDKAKMAELKKEMQNVSKNGVMDDYNSFLMREYPMKINEKVFNRFFGN